MKIAFAVIAALAIAQPVFAGEIPDATVEKILGIAGVKHTTKKKTQFGKTYSDVYYQDGKGDDLLIVRLGTPEQYGPWKQAAGSSAKAVDGVGVEAFEWKAFRSVCAKTTTSAACATPNFLHTEITNEQVTAIVKAAL